MALDVGVLSQLQPPQAPDILGPYQKMQALRTQQLQQQDIASQVQERQQEAQMRQIQNQKALAAADLIQKHVTSGGSLDDDNLINQLSGIDPQLGMNLRTSRENLKKIQAETGHAQAETESAQATTAKTKEETERGPAPTGGLIWDKIQKQWKPAPTTPTQEAEIAEKTAQTRKANADALKTELESGNFPQDINEATNRLNAIAPPTDKDLAGVNTRFAGVLKAGNQTPAYFASTLKDALAQADKVASARAQAPIKIEQSIATAQAGAAGATGSGLDLMAEQALNGSFSSRNPALMSRVYERAAALAKERGLSSTGVIMAQNAAKANKEALGTLTNQQAQVEAFSQTAEKNMKVLEGAMSQVSDLGAPFLNTPMRNLQSKYAGNTKVTAFYAALQPVQTEIAKILNSSNASGVLTDNARNEMQAALGPGATPGQLKAALDIFRSDIANRKSTYDAMLKDLTEKTAVGAGAASGGTVKMVTPDGKVWNVPADKVSAAEARGAKRQ